MKPVVMIAAAVLLTVAAQKASAQFYAVHLNALSLTSGTLSGGMDVTLSPKSSLDLTLYWNPLRFSTFRSTFFVAQAGVRFWRFEPHVGAFWCAHLAAGCYDIGNRKRHYRGMLIGLGASWGYSWLLSKRWSLSAEIGAGLYYTSDTRRDYFTPWSEDEVIRRNRRLMLLPSKAEVGFSYLF